VNAPAGQPAVRCPVCDGPVKIRATGRPPTYCGKACRQTAYRARQAAAAAAASAQRLRQDLTVLQDAFLQAARAMNGAFQRMPAPGTPGAQELVTGWEDDVACQAGVAMLLLRRVAGLAAGHSRAAADYEAAQTVLRRVGLARPGGDETAAGSVGP
jgi:hypothetical protein